MNIQHIEDIVIDSLKNSKRITLLDIGGIEEFKKNFSDIKTSKFLSELLKIIIDEIESSININKMEYEDILLSSLQNCNDMFSIQEVISILESFSFSTSNHNDSLFFIYLNEANNHNKLPIVRSWLLEAAFRFALKDKSKRFRLITAIIEISMNEDDLYLKHASKILGLSYSCWQEEELVNKLEEIKLNSKSLDDVFYELGMCFLLKALNSDTKETAILNFINSKNHFKRAVELNIERPDAIAYESCISILITLSKSDLDLNFQENLNEITKAITIYSIWHQSSNDTIWMNARSTELVNWYTLIDKLNHLLIHFKEPSWYEPKVVIETYLLNIYTASRTILKKDKFGGLEKIIQPKIEKKFINDENKLYLLESWLSLQEKSELGEIGKNLKNEIKKYKSEFSNEFNNSLPSYNKLSNNNLSHFNKFVNEYKNQTTNNVSIKIEEIFNKIITDLSIISDLNNEEVRLKFSELLFLSLKFLESRMNDSKTNFKDLDYLFEQNKKPKESELQTDYYKYMNSMQLHGTANVEKSDVASGRVDVYFTFNKFNISAEIKREMKDCSFESIRTNYLGQTAEYSNTDVKLGFLLVLDLTPKPNGIKSIESCVKVEFIEKDDDTFKRAIVVIVLPGMRKTPSDVKIK